MKTLVIKYSTETLIAAKGCRVMRCQDIKSYIWRECVRRFDERRRSDAVLCRLSINSKKGLPKSKMCKDYEAVIELLDKANTF